MAFKSFIVTLALLAVVGHSNCFWLKFSAYVRDITHLRYVEPIVETHYTWTQDGDWDDINALLEVGNQIAQGGFSTIHLGVDRSSGEHVIIKKLEKSFYKTPERKNDAETELKIYLLLPKNDHLCGFNGYYQDADHIYYSLENCGSSTVRKYFSGLQYAASEEELKRVYSQVLDAMIALHKNGIYHLDFQDNNYMYNPESGVVKVGDFGLSITSDKPVDAKIGTPGFTPPERLEHLPFRGREADVWYFGVSMFRDYYGTKPFGLSATKEERESAISGKFDFPSNKPASNEFKDLLKKIFTLESERPTENEIAQHSWFKR